MTKVEKQKLREFVDYYSSAFTELKSLQTNLEEIKRKRDELSEIIKKKKEAERLFLESLSNKYGEDYIKPENLIQELGYDINNFQNTNRS